MKKTHTPKKRVTLQASSDSTKAMTFKMDRDTEENIKRAQRISEELLNLKCSAAVIIRRALHYYVNMIQADGIDALLNEDGEKDFKKLAEFLEQEREAMFMVAGRADDGRH